MKEAPIKQQKGDIWSFDDVDHVFERVDPDGVYTYVSLTPGRVELEVPDAETGELRKPRADDLARLMAAGRAVRRAKDLEEGPRRAARKRELEAGTARIVDPKADFRTAFTRDYDADPCGFSDRALEAKCERLLADPVIAALPGARMHVGSTLRGWVHTRGRPGDRRVRDGVAMTGYRSGRRVRHPKEIAEHWIAEAVGRKTVSAPSAKARAKKGYEDYKGEITRINKGLPTGRDVAYPQPPMPYKAVSYTTFWRMCRDAQSSAATRAQHGAQAVYQRFGGGGRSERPTRVGALCMMDDTPVPAVFLVDEERGIPLGQATFTSLMDCASKVIPGFTLGWESASTVTVLRTYAHANKPKAIPADIDALHPELKWICLKPDALLVDNLTAHHGRSVEDSLLDAGTDIHFAGSEMPRDKAEKERSIGTILDLAFKDLPAATYDIPRAREFGFDPTKMVMVPLRKANELLLRAICVHHLSPHKGLDGRPPALVFKQHAARHGIPVVEDLDQFERAIGIVDYDRKLRQSGVVVNGLRYSDARATRALYDDLLSLRPPSKTKQKQPSLPVKIKYSDENIGHINVWNDRTRRYVTLPCVTHAYAEGMPLWAHKRLVEIAGLDTREYHEEDEASYGDRLIEMRKRLFEEIRNIAPDASEQARRDLAMLKDHPLFKRVIGDIVEVVDEGNELVQPNGASPFATVPASMASAHRGDATVKTPRPATASRSRSRAGKERRDSRDAPHTTAPRASAPAPSPRPAAGGDRPRWGASLD